MENHGLFSSIRIKVANPNRDDITAEPCQRSSCTLGVTQSTEHTRSLLTRTKTTGRLETVSARRHLFTTVHILSNLAPIHKKLRGVTAVVAQPVTLTENAAVKHNLQFHFGRQSLTKKDRKPKYKLNAADKRRLPLK